MGASTPQLGLRLEERAPSITTLIVDMMKGSPPASGSAVSSPADRAAPADTSNAGTSTRAPPAAADAPTLPGRFSGFATDAPGHAKTGSSPFAASAGGDAGATAESSECGDPADSVAIIESHADALAEAAQPGEPLTACATPAAESDGGPGARSSTQVAPPTSPRGPAAPSHAAASSSQATAGADAQALAHLQQRLQALLPGAVRSAMPRLLPVILPGATAAALTAANEAAGAAIARVGLAPELAEAVISTVLAAALPAALATVMPQAVSTTLSALLQAAGASLAPHAAAKDASAAAAAAPAAGASLSGSQEHVASAAIRPEDRQTSLDQQGAAELQLVRMLFGADAPDAPQHSVQQSRSGPQAQVGAVGLDAAAAGASAPLMHHAGSRPSSTACSPPVSTAAQRVDPEVPFRPPSNAHGAVADAAVSPRGPEAPPAAAAAQRGNAYSRRLSEITGAAAARANGEPHAGSAGGAHQTPPHHHPAPAAAGHHPPGGAFSRSSVGSAGATPSWGVGEDVASSPDEALSTCSAGDGVPLLDASSAVSVGTGAGSHSHNFLPPGSGPASAAGLGLGAVDPSAAAAGMFGLNGEALMDRLHQLQPHGQADRLLAAAQLQPHAMLHAGGGSASAAATSAAAVLILQQQAQHSQQQQQHAAAAVAAAAQAQQLQQLQALVAARGNQQAAAAAMLGGLVPADGDIAPPSPPLGAIGGAGGLQWRRSSGTNTAYGAGPADLWQPSDADALGFAAASLALGQQQQQAAAAVALQQQQLLAAVAAANAAGRPLRAEDLMLLGGGPAAGLQLPHLAAVAAAAGGAATGADLAAFMDASLRRMLLVSPQVAQELARACGAFAGAQAQLQHLCGVIAEQLLDVAAMAPEVAAALLRALAAHRARGAQATDVDPRVMGRILQLLRAGPAGRHLCLVSLEQWVDGLSRIHKRRAYLDTILHNYQLTLKRLVQAMGHQVHAVNMSLPRQLLNDLSPRALLLLTAELAPYPLLQPRRWSEEIIWTLSQMHAMGIEMPAANANPSAAAASAAASVQGGAPLSAFQWEIRRALASTAEDIAASGGNAAAGGQSPPGGSQLGGGGGTTANGAPLNAMNGGAGVPWAAHAALHRHLLLGLRRVQTRFFTDRLRSVHGLYGEAVETLLRTALPQDVVVPEREVVVLVTVLLMLECRMRPEDFDAAFGRDLQRCLAVCTVEEVAGRLRCGLAPDSPLRLDPVKSRALSHLLKMGAVPGQAPF